MIDTTTRMIQALRWFGPNDAVSLESIRQTGAEEVVTALHDVPNGAVWSVDAIRAHKDRIAAAGLGWSVVESLPVHEGIKTRSSDWPRLIENYAASIANLATCGIKVVTYNFMPLLDWTRTDLAWRLPDGAKALRFEWDALAAYDLFILQRSDAYSDYDDATRDRASVRFSSMTDEQRLTLERTILAGLPGAEEHYTSSRFLKALETYDGIDADALRANHHAFMEAVAPIAASCGIQMVVHPDDPPFSLFGLPRVVSGASDLASLFDAVPEPANGLCFCAGSLGARADNDLVSMVREFGSRIGFLHLRSVQREEGGAFHEAEHLQGDADMPSLMLEIVEISRREGRRIPMRPDHGHQMLDDLERTSAPGYSLLGRMRGLAELRGLETGIARALASDLLSR